MRRRGITKPIADYWSKNYCTMHCTLCGNTGIIDTRGTRTPAGWEVGRLNWCLCPNGQLMRYHSKSEPTENDLLRSRQ